MKLKKRIPVIFMTAAVMVMTAVIPASAAAPKKESTEYKGKGKVEVEFTSKVYYKKSKVTVKDTSGKKYTACIYDRDSDDMKFKIKNYKTGKTYKYTISGVKKRGTAKYGKVSGKVTIPAAKSQITADKAYNIALEDAKTRYGADTKTAKLLKNHKDYDDGIYEYEIEFTASADGVTKEFEYSINASTGKILERECEVYDPYDD